MKILSNKVNRDIGRAMHDYGMLADRDRVLIAVSGGVDSLVLAFILKHWRDKAPIHYELTGVYLDNGFDASTSLRVEEELRKINLPHLIEPTDFWQRAAEAGGGRSICYHCARLRRNRLFAIAAELNYNKIAFGHHRDDILETFFINLLYAGNLSTMVPNQRLFHGRLHLIRPMAYLEKKDILEIAGAAGIVPVKNPCPKDSDSKRQAARKVVAQLSRLDPGAKSNIFAALANIRPEYLLSSGKQ